MGITQKRPRNYSNNSLTVRIIGILLTDCVKTQIITTIETTATKIDHKTIHSRHIETTHSLQKDKIKIIESAKNYKQVQATVETIPDPSRIDKTKT